MEGKREWGGGQSQVAKRGWSGWGANATVPSWLFGIPGMGGTCTAERG